MPRQVRIQFPGAVYHVMARGDRREDIFVDDLDRKMFLAALEEVCGRTGWLCHAYVLMGNHYHLVLETPKPTLVAGMSWLQNAFTRRHNVRHKLWGHLFGGRYKAVLVDPDDSLYLPVLIDYVHLNPVRAGLLKVQDGQESYPWSSLAKYVGPAEKRPPWLVATKGLRMRGCEDCAEGRRTYLEMLDRRANEEGVEAGLSLPTGQSLQSTLRRGWLFGSEAFKERMVELSDGLLRLRSRSADFAAAPSVREHQAGDAERLVQRGLEQLNLSEEDLSRLPKGERRKALMGLAIKRTTTVPLEWIAKRLGMGVRSTVSRELVAMSRLLTTDEEWRLKYALLASPIESARDAAG